jgi:hypothetical protein
MGLLTFSINVTLDGRVDQPGGTAAADLVRRPVA